MVTVQWVFTGVHVVIGCLIMYLVVRLEERSFLQVFKAEMKERRDEIVYTEDIE